MSPSSPPSTPPSKRMTRSTPLEYNSPEASLIEHCLWTPPGAFAALNEAASIPPLAGIVIPRISLPKLENDAAASSIVNNAGQMTPFLTTFLKLRNSHDPFFCQHRAAQLFTEPSVLAHASILFDRFKEKQLEGKGIFMERALQDNSAFFCCFAVAACWLDAYVEDEVYDEFFWISEENRYWGVLQVANNTSDYVNRLLGILNFELYVSPMDIEQRLTLMAVAPAAKFYKPIAKSEVARAQMAETA